MKKRIGILMILSLMISAFVFADVADNTMVYGKALQKIDVILGDENGNLNGNDILTREQALVTLTRMMGVDESKLVDLKTTFTDVPEKYWAEGYIAYAAKEGWTKGLTETKFGVGDPVTTQQYTTFMLRALGYTGENVYTDAMQLAEKNMLLKDVKNAKATDTVKRSDAFAILYHTLEAEVKDANVNLATKLGKILPELVVMDGEPSKSLYPLSIKNYDDSILVLEKRPERVVSLTLGTDELLLGIDDPKFVVGLSGQEPTEGSGFLTEKAAAKYPKMENNFEIILSQKPDLVIGPSWGKKELKEQLKDSGIDYYAQKSPNTIAEHKDFIINLSKVLGAPAKGEAIVNDWNKRLAVIEAKANTIKEADKLTVLPYNMHGKTNAKGTVVDEIIYLIGAKNAATEAGLENRAKISKEKIIEINPDVILLTAWAMDDLKEFDKFVQDMKNDPAYQGLKAVKNDKIIVADNRYLMIVTQYLINGVEFVAEKVYPEVYGK